LPAIKAVILDLDGTLIDSEPRYRVVDAEMLAEQGIVAEESDWDEFIGVGGKEFIDRVTRKFGLKGDPDALIREKDIRYLELARGTTEVFQPVRELLLELVLRGVKLGLATSSRRLVLDAMLEETGLGPAFQASVSSDDVENLKPAPDAFLRVADSMAVAPRACCVIEDSQYGVLAARAAGMAVIAVPAPGHETYPAFEDADLVFEGGAARLDPGECLRFLGLSSDRERVDGFGPSPAMLPGLTEFRETIREYYRRHQRSMPWRETEDPYAILVSEIMLQQTQTDRVMPHYLSFLERFPTIVSLAGATLQEVLVQWRGLGYNRRGKSLHDAARIITERHGGRVPEDIADLLALPGVGPYTAGAVRAFAWGRPEVIIETNIRRVMLQVYFPGRPDVHDREIIPVIAATLDNLSPREWYYALMDYGSYLGRNFANPNRRSRHYVRQAPLKGSVREVRGRIIAVLSGSGSVARSELERIVGSGDSRFEIALSGLERDGMVVQVGGSVRLP